MKKFKPRKFEALIDEFGLDDGGVAPTQEGVVSAEEVFEKINLTDLYCCTRTWSAWGHNTMRQNDFIPLSEVEEFREEIIQAMHTYANQTRGKRR